MPRFKMTPDEIEIIKELRLDAIACKCTMAEYLNQVVGLAYELVASQRPLDDDNGLIKTIRAQIEQRSSPLSNWSIGEKGEIIKPKQTKED